MEIPLWRLGQQWSLHRCRTERAPLDPVTIKLSSGLGYQTREDQQRRWSFDVRSGLRAQRTFGHGLGEEGREFRTGVELVSRWEMRYDDRAEFWLQYEGFARIDDPEGHRNLLTGRFDYRLNGLISLSLSLRAYYQGAGNDDDGTTGTDTLSMRQDALVGLLVEL